MRIVMQMVCCVFVLAVSITAQSNDTYYNVELNHQIIRCQMCPPGTFWIKHCSQDGGNAQCEDCPDGEFITDYNRVFYCKRCTECTRTDQPSGEVLVEACTPSHNTICGCKPGYWREEGKVGDCQEVSQCELRYGVKQIANSHNDTTCERCVNGKTFSNISSDVTPCQNCSVCAEGWVQKTPCNETKDTMCIPKDEVEEDSVGVIVGAACVVILVVAILIGIIIAIWCRERTNARCQMLLRRRHQEKLDEEEANQ
ncbi:tumor necrosis factor receptor superfamily member 16-like [Mya arenaria]|uniref:tumor necrosis factor receptor superfamily member 16-like n=1 Tax=Mya arenaria TaxID=6604 RepID=UPI0022DF791D|nr:tumor necrosis factor receptor superfamily member 16-like [Mya arenaria]